MKKHYRVGAGIMAVSMLMSGLGCFAEEAVEASTEAVAEAVETEKAEDFVITLEDGSEIFVENLAGQEVTAEAACAEEDAEAADILSLTAADGSVHVFEELTLADMSNAVLTTEDTFLFIAYANAAGENKVAYETAEEVTLAAPETYYVLNDVYVREAADKDAAALAVAALGDEVTVTAALPKWCKATLADGQEGYIARAYLSQNKEDAEAAVTADANTRAAQQAAAAAAAAAAAQAQQSQGQSQGKYEVSREKFDDCDGSGHGYAIVHYSDGSTATVTY